MQPPASGWSMPSGGSGSDGTRPLADCVPSGFPAGGASWAASWREESGGGRMRASRASSAPAPRTDTIAAAEWRAYYGASAVMMDSTANTYRSGGTGVSYMTPIFHLTSPDAAIVAMEHNNHCKLLGMSTSTNEIIVTWTQLLPVIEDIGNLRTPDEDAVDRRQTAPLDPRLEEWDPAMMSTLIDKLPYTCTELAWAPWQHGIHLAALCPHHGLRLYRYFHGRWALDDRIPSTESVSCSISMHFTIACACTNGHVELWARDAADSGAVGASGAPCSSEASGNGNAVSCATSWVLCRTLCLPLSEDEDDNILRTQNGGHNGGAGVDLGSGVTPPGGGGAPHPPTDILSVAWDESGSLLAVGDSSGAVYVVAVTHEGTCFGRVVYQTPPVDPPAPCKQVAWSPSSGRSFASLAMVFSSCVRVVLFLRPRFLNAAGLPQGIAGAGLGSGARHTGGASVGALQVLEAAEVTCDEVVRLSWNKTGTRFVTAHQDSAVNLWAVDVRYLYPVNGIGEGCAGDGGMGSAIGDGAHRGGSATPSPALPHEPAGLSTTARGEHYRTGGTDAATADKRLHIVLSIRRSSAVHPYHVTGGKGL